MKTLMSVLLGLSLIAGTATVSFAAQEEKKEKKKKKKKEGEEKKPVRNL